MSKEIDGAALAAEAASIPKDPKVRRRTFTPEVARARHRERATRSSTAQGRAFRDLARLHHEEYRALFDYHLEKIHDERGPLPGDE